MDKKKMLKVIWYALLLALVGCGYFSFETGWLSFLWVADSSKLTFAILGLFLYSFLKLGALLHGMRELHEDDIDSGYETCDLSMGLGMLGTVIGFIIMTTAFAGVDISNIENIRQLFNIATQGMSTALYTTAAGLIVSLKLRVLYYTAHRWLVK